MNNPLPKTPRPAMAKPALPKSDYHTRVPPTSTFRPSCTHLTMTRLYDPNLVSFDLIGASFSDNLTVRPRSPESRSDRLSFFSEITPEQFKSYTPEQIRTILSQREHVLKVANEDSSGIEPPPGFEHMSGTKAWVPAEHEECQFKCCVRCRPSAESRSFLNLDEIVNGVIPPSAAIGFSFQRCGRPVIHPSRLENIGLRPVLWPRAYASTILSSVSSMDTFSYSSLEGETIADAEHIQLAQSVSSQGSSSVESGTTEEHHLSDTTMSPCHTPRLSKEDTKSTVFTACLTPLPPAAEEEQTVLGEHSTKMMDEEMEEGRFHKEPLEVDHGVAFSEEGVGLGLADVKEDSRWNTSRTIMNTATRWARSSMKPLHSPSYSTNSHQVTAKWLQRILEDHSEPPRLYAWTPANLSRDTNQNHTGMPLQVLSASEERRRIYILGVGNLGRLYAICLAKAPDRPPITLVVHRKELLAHWRDSPGVEIVRNDGESERDAGFDVEWWTDVKPDFGAVREPGFSLYSDSELGKVEGESRDGGMGGGGGRSKGIRNLIVATKAADAMPQVDRVRGYLSDGAEVAFSQNGMCKLWPPLGEAYVAHRWGGDGGSPRWCACVTTHGVTALAPFRSLLASPAGVAVGVVGVGAGKGTEEEYLIERILGAPGLAAKRVGTGELWVAQLEKLVVNSVINPLTAVLRCKNGEVFEDRGDGVLDVVDVLLEEAGRTLRGLIGDKSSEGVLLSGEGDGGKGIGGSEEERLEKVREELVERFSFSKLRVMLYSVGEKVAENTSSMLQDVRAGKKTEIEDFNGWLVETARYLDDEDGLPAHEKLIALVLDGKALTRGELVRHFLGSKVNS
ncbi:ketopantoate reductase PanE/ApbA C terminal-domain-containing protein [Annulohypoxylon maeteangense]|uniref:ketopantoate reductase PanE/ApbA C terminal-domain-containing protein n=1 Tax=Annulohypoxylon maeteangense TaxID=1927788 RepID=UPI0020080637|nr:ketopantoate reductase PanE/ApbA C terminal-domain-containing protein [Annulohypoxylon maeteangense]KAI0883350.1 ketopantoate reductase PanE/ApbA C terminal-domain-containing protein [Annulohypoxylon maeteangense]